MTVISLLLANFNPVFKSFAHGPDSDVPAFDGPGFDGSPPAA